MFELLALIIQFATLTGDPGKTPLDVSVVALTEQVKELQSLAPDKQASQLREEEPPKIGTIRVVGNQRVPSDFILEITWLLEPGQNIRYPEILVAKRSLMQSNFFDPDGTDIVQVNSQQGHEFKDIVIVVKEIPAVARSNRFVIAARILAFKVKRQWSPVLEDFSDRLQRSEAARRLRHIRYLLSR